MARGMLCTIALPSSGAAVLGDLGAGCVQLGVVLVAAADRLP